MILTLVRHGKAEAGYGIADEDRKLTDEGIEECSDLFSSLSQYLGTVDQIVSSPLVRAVQTADLLTQCFPEAKRLVLEELSPWGNPATLQRLLRDYLDFESIAFVSHEPLLSAFTGLLLSGDARPLVEFKKGGVSVLEHSGPSIAAGFYLKAHLFPKLYRMLRK